MNILEQQEEEEESKNGIGTATSKTNLFAKAKSLRPTPFTKNRTLSITKRWTPSITKQRSASPFLRAVSNISP